MKDVYGDRQFDTLGMLKNSMEQIDINKKLTNKRKDCGKTPPWDFYNLMPWPKGYPRGIFTVTTSFSKILQGRFVEKYQILKLYWTFSFDAGD